MDDMILEIFDEYVLTISRWNIRNQIIKITYRWEEAYSKCLIMINII
jgi:hypothetical protein